MSNIPADIKSDLPQPTGFWRNFNYKRSLVIAIPYVWLLIFFLLPFVFVFKISFSINAISLPPFEPMFKILEDGSQTINLYVQSYKRIFSNYLYAYAYFNSVVIALVASLLTLLIGYPMALAIARAPESRKNFYLFLIILPFWSSFLLRVYAWIGILKKDGLVNNILMFSGLIDQPLALMNTNFAVFIGIVYTYLPFMILPLYVNLEKQDPSLLEGALDLGCRPWQAFLKITLPLSIPGIVAGLMLVFIPATGEYIIPALLGGKNTIMIGTVLWNEFFLARDWPVASALTVLIVLLLIVPIMLQQYFSSKRQRASNLENG